MEVYILDDLLRRDTIIDRFESLIWTERYSAFGDFQLVIHSTIRSRSQLVEGTRLTVNGSTRVMVIENVENKDDSEGRSLLTVSGRSLESILEDRVVRRDLNGTTSDPNFVLDPNPPATAFRKLFDYICVDGILSSSDVIPMYQPGTLYPLNTIAEPEQEVIISLEPQSLYKALKDGCDAYGLGFRLYRGPDTSKLYFDIYTGDDRTSGQTTLNSVIFAPDLETLTNTAEFRSIENFKNVALMVAKNGSRWVYLNDDAATASGFDRRVVVVNVSDIDLADGQELQDALEQRGKEELSKHKPIQAMDGELPTNSSYVYGVDYQLGDLVEMRNEDGLTNRMRVTEQIFVDDSQGERSYPTLSLDEFITPGIWSSWDANGVWESAPGVWEFAGGTVGDGNIIPNGTFESGDVYGWSALESATISSTSQAEEKRTGSYGLKVVTTAANSGTTNDLSTLAETPTGAYSGSVWFKATTDQVLRIRVEERTLGGVFISASDPQPALANGVWQRSNLTYVKTQPDTVLLVSISKDDAGTFYIDDVDLHKVI